MGDSQSAFNYSNSSTDLRRDCIEAGARALREKTGIQVWDYEIIATMDERAEAALDAILSVLSERADEWDRQAGIAAMSHIDRLLAVLRGDE